MQSLIRNWLPLAVCSVLEAIISVAYFNYAGHVFHAASSLAFLGKLTLAAGACIIAAGISVTRNGKHGLLVLNGVACGALGLIFIFWTGPLTFRMIALFIVFMATSLGIYELATARMLRHHPVDKWLLSAVGVVSVAFALAFLAFVFGWITLKPGSPGESLRWLGSYFGFYAICTLTLALGLHSQSAQGESSPPVSAPRHAH